MRRAAGIVVVLALWAGLGVSSVVGAAPASATPGGGELVPVVPERLLDTRAAQIGYTGPKPPAGATVQLQVTGAGATAVPSDAEAVALNVTGVDATATGHVTVWPCGAPRPNTSNLNLAAGETRPNLVVSKLGTGGTVCLYTTSGAHLLADVAAYYPAGSPYEPVVPERLLDTRAAQIGYAGPKPPAGATVELAVAGAGTTDVPLDAEAVVLNVTGVDGTAAGHVTAWPCGTPRPNTSNLNLSAGQTVPNLVVSKLGDDGTVCLYTKSGAHLLADVAGYYPAGSEFVPVVPERLLDTRAAQIGYAGPTPTAGQTVELEVTGAGTTDVPADAEAVVLNVTGENATANGHITVWPCGSARPNTSNLNLLAGQTAPNLVISEIGDDGRVCLYTHGGANLLADIVGYQPAASGPSSFTVTTTDDGPDADPGDGVCEMTAGDDDCSLRAAIDEANAASGTVDVLVPEGSYELTRPGVDDTNAGGDLDLDAPGPVHLTGLGAGFEIDAAGAGGALQVHSGAVVLSKVATTGASGPGIAVASGADVSLARSATHGNGGPGVSVATGGVVRALHVTISGNGATGGTGGVAAAGSFVADYVTITANSGGGIRGAGQVTLGQSLIGPQTTGDACQEPAQSAGWNVTTESPISTCNLSNSTIVSSVGLIQPLSSDLVPFHPLAAGSRAMDRVPADSGACGTFLKDTDQRGDARPAGNACDAGAVEAQGGPPLVVDSTLDLVDANPGDGTCDVGDGTCTLRAAVTEANTVVGPDTITLAASPTLTRTGSAEDQNVSGDIDIRDTLEIDGQGHVIAAAGIPRVLHHVIGTLEVSDAEITGAVGTVNDEGVGLYAVGGGAVLTGVVIHGTSGGSALGSTNRLEVRLSTIRGNTAVGVRGSVPSIFGGGGDVIVVEDSTVVDNTNGISSHGSLTVDGTTVAGGGYGIAVSSCATRVRPGCAAGARIVSSTISGNDLGLDLNLWSFEQVEVVASTITANGSGSGAGGIDAAVSSVGSEPQDGVTVAASIVGGNDGSDCAGPIVSLGGNLDSDGTCGFGVDDLPSADPLLAPLADNGGPTPTHLPFAVSPVLDAITPGTVDLCDTTLATDQRGVARPAGAGCDVGAVEGFLPGPLPFVLATVDRATDAPDATPGDGICGAVGGGCTLRAAIDEVNLDPDPRNRITIAPGIDPVLSIAGVGDDTNATGDLDVLGQTKILGGGATIDAGDLDRVLDVAAPGVVLDGVTLTGGRLSDVTGPGAGVQVRSGDLVVRRSTIADNRITGTAGRGGGIAARSGVVVRVEQSTLSGNVVGGLSARGGAIHVDGAEVTVVVSTLSGNQAFAGGAALDVEGGGTAALLASTTTANIGQSTVAGGSALDLVGTIVGPGTTAACATSVPWSSSVAFDASCGFPSGWRNVDPALEPLGDNGGPTLTHLLPPGSPWRDVVSGTANCQGISLVDQRGEPRPHGATCDVGAVEGP